MSMKENKTAEHMTKAELVQTFRELQRWYNDMKIAVTKLEEEHTELQAVYNEAVNLNLTMTQRLENQELLLLNEITSSNKQKQLLQQRIQYYQNKLKKLQMRLDAEFQAKLR